MKQVLVQAPL